ncbi:TatD family hydrolase [Geotalea toluenoxydans]|uniref:TatD family hydrolase n=1 Tax=Geotalea toluenoxydans TaxID=421624 RepID=UPI0034E24A50
MRSPLLIDTHCHLADRAFAGRLPAVIRAGRMAGVMKFIVPAIEPEEWQRLQVLHKSHSEIFPAYGLHPMHARLFSRNILEELESCARSAIAIGEIGLDYTLAVSRKYRCTLSANNSGLLESWTCRSCSTAAMPFRT